MKKLTYLLTFTAIMCLCVYGLSSCEKSENKTINSELILGSWVANKGESNENSKELTSYDIYTFRITDNDGKIGALRQIHNEQTDKLSFDWEYEESHSILKIHFKDGSTEIKKIISVSYTELTWKDLSSNNTQTEKLKREETIFDL